MATAKANFIPLQDMQLSTMYGDYNKKKILILGAIQADISSAGWEVEKATFLVVENNRCLLGMDLQPKLGIFTRQVQKSSVSEISETTLPETKDWISEQWRNYFASKYNHVFTRQGRSKNHVVKTNFYSPLIPILEKVEEYQNIYSAR